MHDPMVVAFDIRQPWPQVRKLRQGDPRSKRRGIQWPFAYVAGRELYWPGVITVWHVEPGGADALTVCDSRGRWQWHIHHWRIQVRPLQRLRRSLLTRCALCEGRSTKRNPVNVSHTWDGPRGRWWQGEPGLYHRDCSAIVSTQRKAASKARAATITATRTRTAHDPQEGSESE